MSTPKTRRTRGRAKTAANRHKPEHAANTALAALESAIPIWDYEVGRRHDDADLWRRIRGLTFADFERLKELGENLIPKDRATLWAENLERRRGLPHRLNRALGVDHLWIEVARENIRDTHAALLREIEPVRDVIRARCLTKLQANRIAKNVLQQGGRLGFRWLISVYKAGELPDDWQRRLFAWPVEQLGIGAEVLIQKPLAASILAVQGERIRGGRTMVDFILLDLLASLKMGISERYLKQILATPSPWSAPNR